MSNLGFGANIRGRQLGDIKLGKIDRILAEVEREQEMLRGWMREGVSEAAYQRFLRRRANETTLAAFDTPACP
jgi:hypothetical protein